MTPTPRKLALLKAAAAAHAMTTGVREPTAQKLALLKAAAAAHVANAAAAAAGRDVDRLLFGLNMLAERESDRALFRDPSFAHTKHWAISTSHLTHEAFDNWGWGEVVPDGVGVAYMIKRRGVFANVAAVRDAARRWPARFTHLLHEALEEMRALCEASAAAAAGSKL
ncbi:hypothetical protein JKP88DRAFT_289083 [Tribonema minus]|uniref:Choline/carnitine acyltransferase domain-containing protein n=1 Tax=Tribonema minus TaxID=303371 RepID=A0A835Z951_9STRA|nr:hypothetical protein JKP88DRAFT_289083 [Tribonema minus]